MTKKELRILDAINKQEKLYRIIESKGTWNGYNVYAGYFEEIGEVTFSGSPIYILEKDGVCRLSTYDEGFAILDYRLSQKNT